MMDSCYGARKIVGEHTKFSTSKVTSRSSVGLVLRWADFGMLKVLKLRWTCSQNLSLIKHARWNIRLLPFEQIDAYIWEGKWSDQKYRVRFIFMYILIEHPLFERLNPKHAHHIGSFQTPSFKDPSSSTGNCHLNSQLSLRSQFRYLGSSWACGITLISCCNSEKSKKNHESYHHIRSEVCSGIYCWPALELLNDGSMKQSANDDVDVRIRLSSAVEIWIEFTTDCHKPLHTSI